MRQGQHTRGRSNLVATDGTLDAVGEVRISFRRTGLGGKVHTRRLAVVATLIGTDPFNVRVSNALKVLHHLEKYTTLTTEHFELRYDPNHDKFLIRYLTKYLEEIYAELTQKFNYKPKDRILIEVFNTHDMFSGRVVSLPDLHTIGACTGRMVAMVSPRGKGIAKPFNWSRVLRHELVHIFNLEQTHFQVPHWYTEGLAVMNEGFPRPLRAKPYASPPTGRLPTADGGIGGSSRDAQARNP